LFPFLHGGYTNQPAGDEEVTKKTAITIAE
jgi:hypothetical protein